MRVLGLDPGLTRCGVGIIDALGAREAGLVDVSVLRSAPSASIDERIRDIGGKFERILERFAPDVVAIERVFSDRNVSTVIGTAHVSGVVMYLAATRGIPVAVHTPTEVKAAVTGSGRAEKTQVQSMVRRILGLAETPRPADAADALAIAICQLWRGTGPVTIASHGGARTSAQTLWAEAERASRRSTGYRGTL